MTRALAAAALLAASPAWAVYQCGDTQDTCPCGMNNPYPCCDNGGNCTWYAWHSACCNWGVGLPGWGNANQWAAHAKANANYEVKSYAVVNAISCRDVGTYGHVAYVTGLSGSNVSVREQNCWGNYGVRSASYAASYFTGGYIVRTGQVQCRPGDSQTQSCGNCGTQSRGCGDDGQWGAWSACTDEGACHPGDVEETSCGDCGTQRRTCTSSCQWSDFSACEGPSPEGDAGVCDTGQAGACGRGALTCVGGNLTCEVTTTPSDETCDGVDNDCDGEVDEADACAPDAGVTDAGVTETVRPDEPSASASASSRPMLEGGCVGCGAAPGSALLASSLLLRLRRRQRGAGPAVRRRESPGRA